MKIYAFNQGMLRPWLPPKILLIMKVVIIILTTCLLQVSAATFGQRVTLSETDVPLELVLKKIQEQTGYDMLYMDKLLLKAKKVTISLTNSPLEVAMDKILKDQDLTYTITDQTIIIKEKAPTFLDRLANHWAAIDVRGRVVDQEGKPLPGATVKIKSTGKSVSTNAKGEFYIEKVDEGEVLVISFIGYVSKEVSAMKEMGNVVLELSDSKLDEVQVIAYGETTRRLSTGNVSTVKAADIEKAPVSNLLLAIQARVPGIFIEQATGIAGSGISVRIQGRNSIGMGNDPFYVIDGVPYVSQLLPNNLDILGKSGADGTFGSQNGNPLNFINPADIESIDVLKDADATAIYGSRAANGAILITTKKGKAGKTQIDFRLQQGMGKVGVRMAVLNAQQYLEMRREGKANDNSPIRPSDYDLNGVWDTTRHTNWQKELIGKNSQYTNLSSSVSGGTESAQFLISAGYHRETTVFPGNFNYQKGSLHFSISHNPNRRFKLQLSGSYLTDANQLPGQDLTGDAISLPPVAPALFTPDGNINWALLPNGSSTWTNPLAVFLYNRTTAKTDNLLSNLNLSYQLFPGLAVKTSFGFNSLHADIIKTVPLAGVPPIDRPFMQRRASYTDNNNKSWIIEPQLTYVTRVGRGSLDLLIGTTIQQNKSEGVILGASGFNSDLILEDIKSAVAVEVNSSTRAQYKYAALFGRVNYNWQDKYILNFTARRDGSSRFGSENLFHNFASIGGAWVFSNEDFIKDRLSFLSFGKLRGSYGTTGNDNIGDYTFLNLYRNADNYGRPYQGVTGLQPNGLSNPYIQWEETKKLQFGMELGFVKDRFLLNVNYFRNQSSNQILGYNLSIITGVPEIATNFPATVRNYGWEISLNTVNSKRRDFIWSTNVNISLPKNKLVAFPNLDKSSYFSSALVIGQPLSLNKVYHFLGVDPSTGFYIVADRYGKPTSNPNPSTDKTVYINTAPIFYGGFQNTFSYKRFELGILFQFVKQKASNNYFFVGTFPGFKSNQPITILDRWQKNGDIASIQKYSTGFNIYGPALAAASSDRTFSDASYVRLKNLSFSWRLSDVLKEKVKLQQCKLFIQGQNLFTITNYPGMDPENKNISSLPILRILTAGIQVTL